MTTDLDTPNWWGGENRSSGRPSLLGLIENGTLDLRTAALLWLLVERKSSILAAAGPQLAGKTTLLTALLDVMPTRYEKVLTGGMNEDFSFLQHTTPKETYLLVAELSNHLPAYLWGEAVPKLFDALDRGYSMLATMHADTPDEVLQILHDYPVFIPDHRLHHIGVVVNLALTYGEHSLVRRVTGVTLIEPEPSLVKLVDWNAQDDSLKHSCGTEDMDALARHVGMAAEDVMVSLERHENALPNWLRRGDLKPTAVVRMAQTRALGEA